VAIAVNERRLLHPLEDREAKVRKEIGGGGGKEKNEIEKMESLRGGFNGRGENTDDGVSGQGHSGHSGGRKKRRR